MKLEEFEKPLFDYKKHPRKLLLRVDTDEVDTFVLRKKGIEIESPTIQMEKNEDSSEHSLEKLSEVDEEEEKSIHDHHSPESIEKLRRQQISKTEGNFIINRQQGTFSSAQKPVNLNYSESLPAIERKATQKYQRGSSIKKRIELSEYEKQPFSDKERNTPAKEAENHVDDHATDQLSKEEHENQANSEERDEGKDFGLGIPVINLSKIITYNLPLDR